MNIKQAKEDIKRAVTAYLAKDKFGNYVIPIERQRPIFVMGAPGIGKTAIMEQIASEMNIGLVSYSMTHHTRQSALGLPYIADKEFGGVKYKVSEYTMSEIIASVYKTMENSSLKEGILFLDEINCVSETLAPAMLQFLQYKTFGMHKVPDGWTVVTAGNPPEFNNSVREFDIVTWDRLKRLDVEANYDVWKEYAVSNGVHAAITTYLDIEKSDFYKIETTVDGKSFVTARGWCDLSEMIKRYEDIGYPVDVQLVKQYIQNEKIARKFAAYYDLFNKYRSDYQIDNILSGKVSGEIIDRAKNARFDERLSLIGLLLDSLSESMRSSFLEESALADLVPVLKLIKAEYLSRIDFAEVVECRIGEKKRQIEAGKSASNLTADKEYVLNTVIEILRDEEKVLNEKLPKSAAEAFKLIKSDFDKRRKVNDKSAANVGNMLKNVFCFFEQAFSKGSREMLILVTELSINEYSISFISRNGCDEYYANNKDMMFDKRKKQILSEIKKLDLDIE